MTVKLRAHHLLCVLTYVGKGYSPAFTANYDVIVGRLAGGEEALIVDGPDDICGPLLGEAEPHCWNESVTERDRLAASELGELLSLPIGAGTRLRLDPALLAKMRESFALGHSRRACSQCEWADLCSTISSNGYADVRLPSEP